MAARALARHRRESDRDERESQIRFAHGDVRDVVGQEARFESQQGRRRGDQGDGARVGRQVAGGVAAPQRGALTGRVHRLRQRLSRRQRVAEDDVVVEGRGGASRLVELVACCRPG